MVSGERVLKYSVKSGLLMGILYSDNGSDQILSMFLDPRSPDSSVSLL